MKRTGSNVAESRTETTYMFWWRKRDGVVSVGGSRMRRRESGLTRFGPCVVLMRTRLRAYLPR
jgi:hypothetical protein